MNELKIRKPRSIEGNYITVKIGNRSVDALVDSGAVVSMVSNRLVKELKLLIRSPNMDEKMRLLQVDGAQVPINGITDLKNVLRWLNYHS